MKKRLREKMLLLLLAVAIPLSFSACGGKRAAVQSGAVPEGEITYPVKTDVTLTYWVRLISALGTSVTNYAETPFAKKYMEDTGIKVIYQHPAQGQEVERLNLLIASGDLPDIIESDWLSRNPDSSIDKKTILKLNDLFDKQAPNVKAYLSQNPQVDKAVKTDSGSYYVFPFIRGGDKLLSTAGLMLRNDWLKELKLEVPETIGERETVLRAFQKQKGASAPLYIGSGDLNYFMGAYGLAQGFYLEDGKVRYGSYERRYLDFLTVMNRWYQEGFLDKNFALMDNDIKTAGMLNGTGGATFSAGGGGMGLYLNAAKENGQQGYDLVAAPFISAEKGKKPEFGNKQWPYSSMNSAAITGKCKNPEIAARFLDYSYSQAGYMLNNFGVEGESYNMVNGYPTYTDFITKNPNGLSMAQALPLYVRSANEGPFVQDERYIEQYYRLDAQKDALTVWSGNHHETHAMPQVTMTKEETSEYNKIISDLVTYRDESLISFIIGSKPLSEFEDYLNKCKDMKIDRAIEIQQAAYERFLQRK